MSFQTFSDGIARIAKMRQMNRERRLSFGNPFLDTVLKGISPFDLIVMSGKTGSGKTETVTQIALANAASAKNVFLFALESDSGEIEARIKYKHLTQAFYSKPDPFRKIHPNFHDWINGDFDQEFSSYEPHVDKILSEGLSNLRVFYRDRDFTIDTFESAMRDVGEKADLVIMDHLHYFDFDEKNENAAVKRTVKQIREIQQHFRVPIILVCHLRKQDRKNSGLIPDVEDIHGSSDIAKIATKIFFTAPARDRENADRTVLDTYFRIVKNRTGGDRCRYVGLCGFDIKTNQYEARFRLGELDFANTEVQLLDFGRYPTWARP